MHANYRVLAVEDDPDVLALLQVMLRGLPIAIEPAPTGRDAIAAVKRQAPDLMLLDINLPDMRGWDVLDHLKDDEHMRRTHIIVLTSHHEPVHRLIGMLQPIAAYLNKPLDARLLQEHVRRALDL